MPLQSRVSHALDQRWARTLTLGTFTTVGLLIVAHGGVLGWDEAVYSALGGDLADSNFDMSVRSGAYWSDLRAPGFPFLQAIFFTVFGAGDFAARAVVVLCSAALLAVIARTLDLRYAPRVGTTAIIVAALCPGFLATSTLAFADQPAALFAALAVYCFVAAYVTDNTWPLALVPVSLGIATTMRFGAFMLVVAPLAIVGLALVVDAVRRRTFERAWPFVASGAVTLVVLIVLLYTRLLTSQASPVGAKNLRIEETQRPLSRGIHDLRTILEPGPVDYGFAGAFWGWSYALPFALLALFGVARLVIRRRFLVLAVAGTVAAAPFVLYALSVRQFVTTYVGPLFAIAVGALAVALWDDHPGHGPEPGAEPTGEHDGAGTGSDERPARLRQRWPRAALAVAGAIVVVAGVATIRNVAAMHDRLDGWEQVRLASTIADDTLGSDCRILTTRVPQVAWYSDCRVFGFAGRLEGEGPEVVAEFLDAQARKAGATDRPYAMVLMDRLSGQPPIDRVWSEADSDRSVILENSRGRRTALAVFAP